jgi:hypothetical protein
MRSQGGVNTCQTLCFHLRPQVLCGVERSTQACGDSQLLSEARSGTWLEQQRACQLLPKTARCFHGRHGIVFISPPTTTAPGDPPAYAQPTQADTLGTASLAGDACSCHRKGSAGRRCVRLRQAAQHTDDGAEGSTTLQQLTRRHHHYRLGLRFWLCFRLWLWPH